MLLVIDIGNTTVCLGVFEEWKLVKKWKILTTRVGRPDYIGVSPAIAALIPTYVGTPTRKINVIVSSVVPRLNKIIKKRFPQAVFINAKIIEGLGVRIKIKNKNEVGADRLVNALAAYRLYGGPAIIVDFGTATTFDVVSGKGEYLGGAIAPGVNLARDILAEKTAKLPRIEIKPPRDIIGKSTEEALRSGLVYGYVTMVEGMVKRMRKRIRSRIRVIATGGFAKLISKYTKVINKVDANLTLKGLRIAGERLCPKN